MCPSTPRSTGLIGIGFFSLNTASTAEQRFKLMTDIGSFGSNDPLLSITDAQSRDGFFCSSKRNHDPQRS